MRISSPSVSSAPTCDAGEGEGEGVPATQGQPPGGHPAGVLLMWRPKCLCVGLCPCEEREQRGPPVQVPAEIHL